MNCSKPSSHRATVASALTLLALMTSTELAHADWQKTEFFSGNFSVMLPGIGEIETVTKSTPFGEAVEHRCEYAETGLRVLVVSIHESEEFLDKFTVPERIEYFHRNSEASHQEQYPNAVHEHKITTRELLGRSAEMHHHAVRLGSDWGGIYSAIVYVDNVLYSVEVAIYGNSSERALSDDEIEQVFSSFKLLVEKPPIQGKVPLSLFGVKTGMTGREVVALLKSRGIKHGAHYVDSIVRGEYRKDFRRLLGRLGPDGARNATKNDLRKDMQYISEIQIHRTEPAGYTGKGGQMGEARTSVTISLIENWPKL